MTNFKTIDKKWHIDHVNLALSPPIMFIKFGGEITSYKAIVVGGTHSYDILGARMLWKPKEARILKNFIEF